MLTIEKEINYVSKIDSKVNIYDEINSFIENVKIDKQSSLSLILKRILDICISAFVIIFILSWLIPIVTIVIWFDSGDKPFFSQLRNGLNAKPYVCYKFTTMHSNEFAHFNAALQNDSRITKVGKFLRVSCIDEMPQFFNVLIGNMSLVGPRPHMIADNEKFSKLINGYNKRHLVKPGITGLAQIKGYKGPIKSKLEIYKRIEYDIQYAKYNSLDMDFKILINTVSHILIEIKKFVRS